MDEKIGKAILIDITDILEKEKIDYWLDTGTLLGIIRDKHLIPWDHDIDLGAAKKDQKKIEKLIKKFRKQGFEVFFAENETFFKRKGVYLSVVYYKMDKTSAYYYAGFTKPTLMSKLIRYMKYTLMIPNYADLKKRRKSIIQRTLIMLIVGLMKIIPYKIRKFFVELLLKVKAHESKKISYNKKLFENLKTIVCYGKKLYIPNKHTQYLEIIYGKDWKIPKKNWVWSEDYVKKIKDKKKNKKD